MKIILRIVIFGLLTILTQIGGIVYLIAILINRRIKLKMKIQKFGLFFGLYCISTFLIIPYLAPIFGREKIQNTEYIQAHSFFYKLANRNYVKPELNEALQEIGIEFGEKHYGIKLSYLDANFPFLDGFPLLPHLSHNDGKKIDVTLYYENEKGILSNKKKSISGYGAYVVPKNEEVDQISICKSRGNWQYDFPKYLTLGKINKELQFSISGTRDFANIIVSNSGVGKLFIEPHLKSRLNLTNPKVRFHGCQAVRHDDHIHFQLK
ncbi:MAG: hypothetical protein ABJZ88_00350 [Nonlabens ulvanivorans]|uniref:hypothetical protein n=2 Tax=Nonlabens ulvanivorans TaxID=906888 RepID=UPI00329788F9